MTMKGPNPWMKFYPQDWRSDERLRNCSFAARGLWIEMLAIMHRCDRYGYLLINGHTPTSAQLAIQAGGGEDDTIRLMAELEREGVFSRNAAGLIYSRRMIRDRKKAQIAQQNGKSGGNPKLGSSAGNEKVNCPSDKGSLKGEDKGQDKTPLKAQKLEARVQSKDKAIALCKKPIDGDWQPEEFGADKESRPIVDGWQPVELRRQVEAFRAHHQTKQNKFSDWQSAWSTWVLNSVKFERPAAGGYRGPQPTSYLDVVKAEQADRAARAAKAAA